MAVGLALAEVFFFAQNIMLESEKKSSMVEQLQELPISFKDASDLPMVVEKTSVGGCVDVCGPESHKSSTVEFQS